MGSSKETEIHNKMLLQEIKSFLDEKTLKYNQPEFIKTDPIQIPRQFTQKEDIEIAAFLSAVISWGNRVAIIKNATNLMERMEFSPYAFITDAPASEYDRLGTFIHRT